MYPGLCRGYLEDFPIHEEIDFVEYHLGPRSPLTNILRGLLLRPKNDQHEYFIADIDREYYDDLFMEVLATLKIEGGNVDNGEPTLLEVRNGVKVIPKVFEENILFEEGNINVDHYCEQTRQYIKIYKWLRRRRQELANRSTSDNICYYPDFPKSDNKKTPPKFFAACYIIWKNSQNEKVPRKPDSSEKYDREKIKAELTVLMGLLSKVYYPHGLRTVHDSVRLLDEGMSSKSLSKSWLSTLGKDWYKEVSKLVSDHPKLAEYLKENKEQYLGR